MAVDSNAVRDHLASFVASRRGVEAFVEPPTNVTATTVVLIAHERRVDPTSGWLA